MTKILKQSDNLDAKSFQALYEQYEDALKIIENLKKENQSLEADNCYLRQENRGLTKQLPSKFDKIDAVDKTIIKYYDISKDSYIDFMIIYDKDCDILLQGISDLILESLEEAYKNAKLAF